jgi:hypothetical protein
MINIEGNYRPIEMLFENIRNNAQRMKRIPVYLENMIIKTYNYTQMKSRLDTYEIHSGNSIQKARLVSELTLSRYLFRSQNQYISWQREFRILKQETG